MSAKKDLDVEFPYRMDLPGGLDTVLVFCRSEISTTIPLSYFVLLLLLCRFLARRTQLDAVSSNILCHVYIQMRRCVSYISIYKIMGEQRHYLFIRRWAENCRILLLVIIILNILTLFLVFDNR